MEKEVLHRQRAIMRMLWEAKREQVETILSVHSDSIRPTLLTLVEKLNSGDIVCESDSLQGLTVATDAYLARLITLQKVVDDLGKLMYEE